MCFINREMYEKSLEFSNLILNIDNENEKAIYRKSLSLFKLCKYDSALKTIHKYQNKNNEFNNL
jgi:hypothetical protein